MFLNQTENNRLSSLYIILSIFFYLAHSFTGYATAKNVTFLGLRGFRPRFLSKLWC